MLATTTFHVELLQSPLVTVAIVFWIASLGIAVLKYLKRILF